VGIQRIADWIPVFTGMTEGLATRSSLPVIPTEVGIQRIADWIPVFTGMTEYVLRLIP
jgi:hypothetical protein